jgi:glycosyltransferase involved in cell wall biosynthesis
MEAGASERVVLFIPSLGVGGAQRQLLIYLSRMDRARWTPELVTLNMPDKFFEEGIRALGVPVTYLNPAQEYWMCGIVWRLVRHLRSNPAMVVHAWLHFAAMLGAIAGALAGTPVIIGSFRSERPGRFPWFYRKWQRAVDILTAPLHTTLIANSDAVRQDHQEWAWVAPSKLVTIYNGIDAIPDPTEAQVEALRRELGLHPDTPLVGIVGRLSLEKDHRTFLDAARFVLNRRPDARFLIVGEGPLRRQIEADIERWGLPETVKVLGERKDALAIIRLLDVLVLTSRSEGFPNVLLEAAMVGTAVVTTAAGGAAEVVDDGRTGFVVPCRNSWAVGERVLQLLTKPDMRSRFADAARRRAEALFSAAQAGAATEACYRDGLDRSRRLPAAQRAIRACLISPHVGRVLRGTSRGPIGGAEIQLSRLAHALAKDERFSVTVATSDGLRVGRERFARLAVAYTTLFGQPSSERAVGEAGGTLGAEASSAGFAGRCATGAAASLRWVVHRIREARDLAAWVRLLGSIDADLYVMRCASPQVAYARVATRLLGRKLIYLAAHDQDVNGGYAAQQGVWGRRFEWGLRRADEIVCQHGEQAMQLQRRYRRTPSLIRSFCPVEAGPARAMPRTYILWMARLDEWKQPSLFIDLAERFPQEVFLMVGPASETNPRALDEWGGRIGALPNLRFEPGVPFEESSLLFAQAKIFVNTSRGEGFPNTFLQAAACGTPIVSWCVNPDGMLTRHQMGICANGDTGTFEQAVRDLCGDGEFRSRLGGNGRKYVARHHADGPITAQYAHLFMELAGRRPPDMVAPPAAEAMASQVQPAEAYERKSAGRRG